MLVTKFTQKLECGSMPNVMAAMPNTGGALCSMPQSLVAEVHHIIRTSGGGIAV